MTRLQDTLSEKESRRLVVDILIPLVLGLSPVFLGVAYFGFEMVSILASDEICRKGTPGLPVSQSALEDCRIEGNPIPSFLVFAAYVWMLVTTCLYLTLRRRAAAGILLACLATFILLHAGTMIAGLLN